MIAKCKAANDYDEKIISLSMLNIIRNLICVALSSS